MELLLLTAETLKSPPVLFFLLGLIASVFRSDLRFPESLSQTLGIYLILAIGYKGGVELTRHALNAQAFLVMVCAVALSFALPLLAYGLISQVFKSLKKVDRISIAAHYGSVSLVTFIAATSFLESQNVPYDGYFVVLLTLMETPPILTALFLYSRSEKTKADRMPIAYHLRHVIFAGSSFLLIGSFIVGLVSGTKGSVSMYGFLNVPFQGILSLFLLDMGLVTGRQLTASQNYNRKVLFVGLMLPILHGIIGLMVAHLLGLNVGDKALLAILCASASYIVIPAAMRMSLPEANHGLSITLALGITFPFNVIFGIPLFYWLAKLLG